MATGVSPEHTSVPRWASEPPQVDPAGREFIVIWSGDAARPVAEGWLEEIAALDRPVCTHVLDRAAGDGRLAGVEDSLAHARVGARIMVAGPELEVLDVVGAAHRAGALDAELRCCVTEDAIRRVQCPHCHAHTEARVAIGETVDCDGCGRSLIVYHHVSRRHGAYLGYMVDAEDPGA